MGKVSFIFAHHARPNVGAFPVGHGEVLEGVKVSFNPTVWAVKYPTFVHEGIISGGR